MNQVCNRNFIIRATSYDRSDSRTFHFELTLNAGYDYDGRLRWTSRVTEIREIVADNLSDMVLRLVHNCEVINVIESIYVTIAPKSGDKCFVLRRNETDVTAVMYDSRPDDLSIIELGLHV